MAKLLEQHQNNTNAYSKELFEKWFGIKEKRKHRKLEAAKMMMLEKLRERKDLETKSEGKDSDLYNQENIKMIMGDGWNTKQNEQSKNEIKAQPLNPQDPNSSGRSSLLLRKSARTQNDSLRSQRSDILGIYRHFEQ